MIRETIHAVLMIMVSHHQIWHLIGSNYYIINREVNEFTIGEPCNVWTIFNPNHKHCSCLCYNFFICTYIHIMHSKNYIIIILRDGHAYNVCNLIYVHICHLYNYV